MARTRQLDGKKIFQDFTHPSLCRNLKTHPSWQIWWVFYFHIKPKNDKTMGQETEIRNQELIDRLKNKWLLQEVDTAIDFLQIRISTALNNGTLTLAVHQLLDVLNIEITRSKRELNQKNNNL